MGAIKNARHPFYNHCDEALDQIRHAGRYRTFTPLSRQAEHFPVYEEERQDVSGARDVVVWSTNDYLGMGVVPEVQEAAIEAVRAHGAGAGGTRNIAGTSRCTTSSRPNWPPCMVRKQGFCSFRAMCPIRPACKRS